MNITILTGWIAAIFLFFNFLTCLVMPFAKTKVHECGGGGCGNHPMCQYHKPLAILSIVAIIVHIVISLIY